MWHKDITRRRQTGGACDGALMLGLEYVFTTNGLVSSIAESGDSGQVAITTFEHDARGRLTREERVGSEPYLATYRYDANGNRLEDSLRVGGLESPTVQTCYVYYSNHNRIRGYRKWRSSELIEEVGYTYDDYENIRKISRQVCDGGEAWNYYTDLKYDKMGRVWRVLESERPPGGSMETVSAREFRYAGARQRYLTRQLDPSTLDPIPGSDMWSDYLGDSIYGDYTVAGSTATMTQRYVPGEWQTDVQAATTSFFHTNMLGTMWLLSDNLGTAIPDASRLYTAYGVPIAGPTSPTTRYGYAGAWGYQEHEDLSILHVGARHYAPSTGRFLQRDPIGISGGLSVYAYVGNHPLAHVDPEGLNWRHQRRLPNGRFGPKKFLYRVYKRNPYLGAYFLACGVVKGGYWIAGEPYPGHPHSILRDTMKELNSWRENKSWHWMD
ncbi:MAG: RHS repeat-associated core domain-containing protein [Phycisphaerae bacterium]|nr:RHS repeat-associated core domain-containing protein [Phycisphaerae bacterium]